MFAFIIGYFHDNLYLVVLMYIFIVICGYFKWLSLWLYRTWMFADGVTTFIILGTTQITPSSNICWLSSQFGHDGEGFTLGF